MNTGNERVHLPELRGPGAAAGRDRHRAQRADRPEPPGLDLGGDRRAAHHLHEVSGLHPSRFAADELPLDLNAQLAVAAAS